MLTRKKFLAVFLAVLLVATMISGCVAQSSKSGNDTAKTQEQKGGSDTTSSQEPKKKVGTFPIVDEPITLKIMARYRVGMGPFEEMITWQKYEELTNIKIEWIMVENSNYTERRNLALATGDLPDAFLKCGFTPLELLKYGKEGTFIRLNDLIDEYSPNFRDIINDEVNYPGVRQAITMADGNIYSYIYIMHKDFDALRYGKFFMNRKWLNALGKNMPVTLDEFYDVLKAFKEQDPNGNGKADEIPYYPLSSLEAVSLLRGAYGLNNRGFRNSYVDVDESTGKLRFIPTDPRYKEILQYVYKLYNEGLLDQEMFTASLADLLAKGTEDRIGAFMAAGTTYVGPEHENDFEGLEHALKGPYGDQLWPYTNIQAYSTGSFVITSKNKYPEETAQWVDYFYSEDGMKLYFLGEEGVTYRQTANGEYEYTELITNNPEGLDYNHALNKYVPFAVGDNPALLSPKYFKGNETLPIPSEAARRMKPYGLKEVWPSFNYTEDENDRIVALSNDISQYVTEKSTEFITGKIPFSEWDNYVSTLQKMGLDEYMKIQEAAYQRYLKN